MFPWAIPQPTETVKWRRINRDVRNGIRTGALPPGQPLPTQEEIKAAYECSFTPIQKAASVLTADGLIREKRSSGTIVTDDAVEKLRQLDAAEVNPTDRVPTPETQEPDEDNGSDVEVRQRPLPYPTSVSDADWAQWPEVDVYLSDRVAFLFPNGQVTEGILGILHQDGQKEHHPLGGTLFVFHPPPPQDA